MASERHRRIWSRALLLAALAAAPLSITTEAHAQTAADRETARSLMDEGDKKLAAKDYAAALKAYQAADALMNVPTTKIEVGKAQEALGQLVEARDTYYQVGRIPQQPNEPAAFGRARADAASRSTALAARIASIRVSVSNAPAGAAIEVQVDGALIPAAALIAPRKVNPGPHTITVTVAGKLAARKELTLKEAEAAEVALDLAAPPPLVAPPTPAGGATTPPTEQPAPPAAHAPGRRWVLVGVGFGLTGVGLAAGAITGLMSLSQAKDAKTHCVDNLCDGSAKPAIDKSLLLANLSNGSFVVAGAGVVLGMVGLFLPPKPTHAPEPAAAITIRPVVGAGYAGLQGAF